MELENKIIVLTGASSGIGFAIAEILKEYKCKLILIARRIELLKNIKPLIGKAEIHYIKCDVTDKAEIKNAYTEIVNNIGDVDMLILNAGLSHRADIENYKSEYAEDIFKVNVFSMVYFTEIMAKDLLKGKKRIIAGVSSLADSRGFSKSGFYCASKAAATNLLESLRIELKPYNVKVLTIKPGFVRTPMTEKNRFKMPFLMNADKAAKIIVRGLIKEKSIIQFPLPTAIGSKLLRFIPNKIFDIISSIQV